MGDNTSAFDDIKMFSDSEERSLAQDWIRLTTLSSEDEKAPLRWASDSLFGFCVKDPYKALRIIESIAEIDSSDSILANLGAGPLESLLASNGLIVIEEVEKLAARSAGFKKALSAVWKNTIQDTVWDRVKVASRGSW